MSFGMQRSLDGRNIALSPISMMYMIHDLVMTLSILCHISLEKSSQGRAMYGYKCGACLYIMIIDDQQTTCVLRPIREPCCSSAPYHPYSTSG